MSVLVHWEIGAGVCLCLGEGENQKDIMGCKWGKLDVKGHTSRCYWRAAMNIHTVFIGAFDARQLTQHQGRPVGEPRLQPLMEDLM